MSFTWFEPDAGDKLLQEAIEENERDGAGRMSTDEEYDSEMGGDAEDIETYQEKLTSNNSISQKSTKQMKKTLSGGQIARNLTEKIQSSTFSM